MIEATNKIAIVDGDSTYTYKEFLQYVTVFSEQLDVVPGAVVMIYSEVRVGYAMALYAIWHKRCRYTTFYHNLSENDLRWAIDDVKPAVIFTSVAQFGKVMSAVVASQASIQVLVLDDLELAKVPSDTPCAELEYHGADIAGIIYTVGISQAPRPALLTFDNYFHNAHALIKNGFITSRDVVITMLPFYNTWVLLSTLVFPLYCGATCVFCRSYDATVIVDTLYKNKVSFFVCVNSVYLNLTKWTTDVINSHWYSRLFYSISRRLRLKGLSKFLFRGIHKRFGNSLRYFLTVGNKIQDPIWEHLLALGFDVFEGYGSQESSNLITIPASKRLNPTSAGKLIEGVECKIIDREIVLHGPNLSLGYYERPFINNIIFNGGWFFTGDEGYIDDEGYVYLTGRINDMITLQSGRVVFPAELEYDIQNRNKNISEVGVFYNDNMLKAIIVPTEEMLDLFGTENNFEKILYYMKWQVVENYNYSVPFHKRIKKIIISAEGLKRSTSGKLKRYLLQDAQAILDEQFWNNSALYNLDTKAT